MPGKRARVAWLTEAASALYIGVIALVAQSTGLFYVLFPELGALGHDILKRPNGTWSRAPLLLVVTPFLTALAGTLVTRHLPYGVLAVLLDVGCSVLIIGALRSPIAPAISAGLLPLCLGVRSWGYPPSLLVGTGLLATIAVVRAKSQESTPAADARAHDFADDIVEQAQPDYSWVPLFAAFVVIAAAVSVITGWRLVLFPPLVVIAFEAFAHTPVCPWAKRPIALVLACGLCALGGVLSVSYLGVGPLGAMCSMLAGSAVLRALALRVPPALAVGLLPFVMRRAGIEFPLAVTLGTALQSAVFMAWRWITVPRMANAGQDGGTGP